MKRKPQPPLNFRFHGTLDLFQLLDVCMEANISKVEKAIADWKSQSEITDKCPKICTNQVNDCPKICIRGLPMDNMPKYKISIVGDSISTYMGFNPNGYPVYYKDDRAYDNEINSVNDTWWKQVIDGIGGELCINNSYSGSLVAGVFESSACSKERCSSLHGESAPDVILIYMGTNDRGYEIKLGLNEPENTMGFYGAYRVMLRQLKNNYPTAKIVCGTLLMGYKKDEKNRCVRAASRYNDAIRLVAKEEGCLLADIAQSGECYETLDYCHPTNKGHKEIAKLWLAALKPLLTKQN